MDPGQGPQGRAESPQAECLETRFRPTFHALTGGGHTGLRWPKPTFSGKPLHLESVHPNVLKTMSRCLCLFVVSQPGRRLDFPAGWACGVPVSPPGSSCVPGTWRGWTCRLLRFHTSRHIYQTLMSRALQAQPVTLQRAPWQKGHGQQQRCHRGSLGGGGGRGWETPHCSRCGLQAVHLVSTPAFVLICMVWTEVIWRH